MKTRAKVAVYIDYSIRVPNFVATYEAFKAELFSDKHFGIDTEDQIMPGDTRFFWASQMQDPAVEQFYISAKVPTNDYDIRLEDPMKYFFNEAQYRQFLDEYSYNLYIDCAVPNKQDIDIINIAQKDLFDVVLVDEYVSKRKVSNTLFFLSKNPIYPQSVMFLGIGQQLNNENYLGVWNPRVNESQVNKQGSKEFLNWFMDLERTQGKNE